MGHNLPTSERTSSGGSSTPSTHRPGASTAPPTGSSPAYANYSASRTAPRLGLANSNSPPTAPKISPSNCRDAFEQLRDTAAEAYRVETGEVWRPRRGSHVSQTGKLTSAMIDARDFQRARKDRENTAHLPQGTLVAVAGGKEANDVSAIIGHLDKLKAKYTDVVLVHGGGPGAEKIAAGWAERNGVHQVVCKPDWDAHGRAAPFRRNDELLALLPKGVIAFPGSGITDNLVDKANRLGIPVQRVAA